MYGVVFEKKSMAIHFQRGYPKIKISLTYDVVFEEKPMTVHFQRYPKIKTSLIYDVGS